MLPLNGSEVELVPDQVLMQGSVIPQGYIATIWDTTIVGLPLWAFVECICILVLIAAILKWVLRLRAMGDVRGFSDNGANIRTGQPILGWRLSANLQMAISAMQYSSGTISFGEDRPNDHSLWIHSRGATHIINGKPSVFLSQQYAVARDLAAENAYCSCIEEINSRVEDPRQKIQSFVDWQQFGHRMAKSIWPDGIPCSSYIQLNPSAVEKYLPKNNTPSFFGNMVYAEALELVSQTPEDNGFFAKYGALLACIGFGMVAMIGGFFIPL